VHEDILRRFVSGGNRNGNGKDDDEEDTAAAILAEHGVSVSGGGADGEANGHAEKRVDVGAEVKSHLQLLKLAYQRLGKWPKPYGVYEQLNADVFRQYAAELKGVEGVEKWQVKSFGGGKAESETGVYVAPSQWDILVV